MHHAAKDAATAVVEEKREKHQKIVHIHIQPYRDRNGMGWGKREGIDRGVNVCPCRAWGMYTLYSCMVVCMGLSAKEDNNS